MEVAVSHPFEADLSLIRNALMFSETPVTEYRYPPRLGENTAEVLSSELGYDAAKLAGLKAAKVI